MKAELRIKKLVRRGLAAALFVSSFILHPSAFSSGDTPIKNAKISGTSAVTGTFHFNSGATVTFDSGSSLDLSAVTLTLPSIVTAATKGDATHVPVITYGADGRISGVTTATISAGSSTFVALTDTPANYTGAGSKLVAVKSDASGLEFISAPTSLPTGGTINQVLTKNSSTNGDASWQNPATGATNLLALTDTPSSYTGTGGSFLKVNSGATGVEFVAAGSAPYARVYNSAAQTIANGAATALTFDSERADTENIHSTSTNTSRLTCVTPGRYVISGSVDWGGSATGVRSLSIRVNGTLVAVTQLPGSTGDTPEGITTIYSLAVGDYAEIYGYQTSGGSLAVNNGPNYSPEFAMVKVGDSTTSGGASNLPIRLVGTSFSTTPYSSTYAADNAVDYSVADAYVSTGTGDVYVGIDLGSGVTATVSKIRVYPRAGTANLTGALVEGSNTSSSAGFSTLATVPTVTDGAWTVINITPGTAYRWFRLHRNDTTELDVAEMEFYGR